MERQYGERIRHLKDKNSQLLAEQENYKLGNRDPHAEQMLSEQLKEMTAVLEEFDLKYTRKEKQLEVARDQNKQLKAAFEQIKDMKSDLSFRLQAKESELVSAIE